jgi:ectoine hydroxylase-related dioxygenase (phytanoyl-CoA dioxygenase family)
MSAFRTDQLDELHAFYVEHGYAVLRGLWDEDQVVEMEAACEAAQQGLVAGALSERYGTTVLVDDADRGRVAAFANYVTYASELLPEVRVASRHPVARDVVARILGEEAWLLEGMRFGVVYQDARPGRESSYTRIGWHSDWQSGPHLDMWPSAAFTIHLDGTSPANGFLRVVPGSHRWATPAPYRNANDAVVPDGSRPAGGHTDAPPPCEMPLGFDHVPGEIALYCERGDLLFHDAYLWHSAARATDDDARRRHIRGGWYSGQPLDPADAWTEDFVKNAAR